MTNFIVETERLGIRPLTWADRGALCEILQDETTMYAYEHAFSDREVDDWITRQLERYKKDGFGLWGAIRKEDGAFVGQIGITMQDWNGTMTPEIGYLLKRRYWGQGYATEGALGCMDYAFRVLKLDSVCSIIRHNNVPSQAVALRNGMKLAGHMVKHYYQMVMPHNIYQITQADYETRKKEG